MARAMTRQENKRLPRVISNVVTRYIRGEEGERRCDGMVMGKLDVDGVEAYLLS